MNDLNRANQAELKRAEVSFWLYNRLPLRLNLIPWAQVELKRVSNEHKVFLEFPSVFFCDYGPNYDVLSKQATADHRESEAQTRHRNNGKPI
jgi:hypothetical protein